MTVDTVQLFYSPVFSTVNGIAFADKKNKAELFVPGAPRQSTNHGFLPSRSEIIGVFAKFKGWRKTFGF